MVKFREFVTSNGIIVLAGKDAMQNEELVNQFKGKGNFIFHTAKPGSPFCVITEKPKSGDKKETAVFCAKRSQDWRDNKANVLVHIFTGKDVFKRKDMALGTFGIKKKRNIKIKKEDIEKFG